jgi:hypothetical protein
LLPEGDDLPEFRAATHLPAEKIVRFLQKIGGVEFTPPKFGGESDAIRLEI